MPIASDGLDGYEFEEVIGRGGFAVVYRAQDITHARLVAIKVINGSLNEAELRRFDRERRAIGRLTSHPNVVPVFDSGSTTEGESYLVLEYEPGGSLGDRILATGPIVWPEAAKIIDGVASAVEAAHAIGVRHRDIKPENMLVSEYGVVKLADFGIASVSSGATATTATSFTLAHSPPEALKGAEPTDAVDIYSLASTFHHLVSGSAPFARPEDEGVAALIGRLISEDPPRLTNWGIPAPVEAVIRRAMSKEPKDRQSSAAEFREDLAAACVDVEADYDDTVVIEETTEFREAQTRSGLSGAKTTPRKPALRKKHIRGRNEQSEPVRPSRAPMAASDTEERENDVAESDPVADETVVQGPILDAIRGPASSTPPRFRNKPAQRSNRKSHRPLFAGVAVASLLVALVSFLAIRESNQETADPEDSEGTTSTISEVTGSTAPNDDPAVDDGQAGGGAIDAESADQAIAEAVQSGTDLAQPEDPLAVPQLVGHGPTFAAQLASDWESRWLAENAPDSNWVVSGWAIDCFASGAKVTAQYPPAGTVFSTDYYAPWNGQYPDEVPEHLSFLAQYDLTNQNLAFVPVVFIVASTGTSGPLETGSGIPSC